MGGTEKLLKEKKPFFDGLLEKYVPREFDERAARAACGKPRYAFDHASLSRALSKPIWDLLDRGGKRWRPALFLLAAEAVGGKARAQKVREFAVVPELVHNGTLIIDDVEDDSSLRRGRPCVHKIYGNDVAINAGNALYFLPLLVFTKNRGKVSEKLLAQAYELYLQEMINVSVGQALDIQWHKGARDPSEAQYLQMCAFKTGCFSRLAAKLGALLAGGSRKQVDALGKFAESIGVAFQIQDDVLNLVGKKFGKLKGVGEDVHEGKRTLMVIHAFKRLPKKDAARLRAILNAHPSDAKTIREAIALIKKSGGIDYAKRCARELVEEAWSSVDRVLKPSEAKNQLREFADYLIEREI